MQFSDVLIFMVTAEINKLFYHLASYDRGEDPDDHGGLGLPSAAVCSIHQQRAFWHPPQHGT